MSFNPIISAQGADGYLVFFTGASAMAGDNDLFFDRVTHNLTLTGEGKFGIGTTSPESILHIIHKDDNSMILNRSTISAGGPNISFRKARGSPGSDTIVNIGDTVGQSQYFAFDGSSYTRAGRLRWIVDGTPSTGIIPGAVLFEINDSSGTLREVMRIESNQLVGIGTPDPHETLTINGAISLQEIPDITRNHDGYGTLYVIICNLPVGDEVPIPISPLLLMRIASTVLVVNDIKSPV